MIARVLLVLLSAFLVGGFGLYAASFRQPAAVRRTRLIKFVTYFCIVNLVVLGALAGRVILSGIMIVVVTLGARELYRVMPRASGGRRSMALLMSATYLFIATGSVLFAWLSPSTTSVFVFLIVCAFDGFSQVSGQMLGKHQLAPRISPGKTIEGSVGGLLFALSMALLLRPVVGWGTLRTLLVCCFIVATAHTGDLLASLVKRRGNVKDFSNLIPGHGGVLDRFDSFLFASAAYMLASELVRLCTIPMP